MILADKIIEERKRLGLSQEELAEKLDVSRQSVSKWEMAQSIPDLNRILEMAKLFGVSTDYLLKDEIEHVEEREEQTTETKKRSVSIKEATDFMKLQEETTPKISLGVSLCVFSPVILFVLLHLNKNYGLSDSIATSVGVSVILVCVASGVYLLINSGNKLSRYDYLEKELIETEYGVTGLVKEKEEDFIKKDNYLIPLGVFLCILSAVPLIIFACFETSKDLVSIGVAILLTMVSIAVYMFVYYGSIKDGYDKLLQKEDYTDKKKIEKNKLSPIMGAYWMLAVTIYLAWSFVSGDWSKTWIIWPIAGVAFPFVSIVLNQIINKNN